MLTKNNCSVVYEIVNKLMDIYMLNKYIIARLSINN